jgi:hypothetical protein
MRPNRHHSWKWGKERKSKSRTETIVAAAFRLREGGPAPGDLDAVAFYEKPFPKLERLPQTCLAFAPFICTLFRGQGKRSDSRQPTGNSQEMMIRTVGWRPHAVGSAITLRSKTRAEFSTLLIFSSSHLLHFRGA